MSKTRKNVIAWTLAPNEIFHMVSLSEKSKKTLWVEEKQMAILTQSYEIKRWYDAGKYDIRNQMGSDTFIFFVNMKSFQYDFAANEPLMNEQLNIPILAMGHCQLTITNPVILLTELMSQFYQIENKTLLEFLDQMIQKQMKEFFKHFMEIEGLFFDIRKISVLFSNYVKADLEKFGLYCNGLKLTYISLPQEIIETYSHYVSCIECKKMIPRRSRFCPHCGINQMRVCEQCGDIIEHQYCPHCGYDSDNTTLE
ncbi:MAG: SPFH domain-containing protein [Clostridia bacterium]|nr:SPFH domain-containing protein [Clostridia bacterium]